MHSRTFGKTGIPVSEVGLGTWQLGGDWGAVDEASAMAILTEASERGISFFDTADVYGRGTSEELIGRFLKKTGYNAFVATKLGRLKGYPDDYSLQLFRCCVEDSLKRLGKECIDLTQLHCIPRKHLQSGEVFGWLSELVSEGKIASYGASVETVEEALICMDNPQLASLQIIFNIFRQNPLDDLFTKAKEKDVALIIRLPLASGLLAGKFTADSSFVASDHRSYNRDGEAFSVGETFSGLPFEKGVVLAEQIRPLVPDSMAMAQFALRWILDHDQVSVVIPGGKNPDQVKMNASVSELDKLDQSVHQKLRAFFDLEVKGHIRGNC